MTPQELYKCHSWWSSYDDYNMFTVQAIRQWWKKILYDWHQNVEYPESALTDNLKKKHFLIWNLANPLSLFTATIYGFP